MKIHELGHLVLYVSDLKRSADFYSDTLGFREIHRDQFTALYSSGRTHHELLLIAVALAVAATVRFTGEVCTTKLGRFTTLTGAKGDAGRFCFAWTINSCSCFCRFTSAGSARPAFLYQVSASAKRPSLWSVRPTLTATRGSACRLNAA